MRDRSGNYLAVIKVVGVGGGGTNAVNRMVDAALTGVEFVAVNTDAQALLMCDADVKIHIGAKATRGLGAGADPAVGHAAGDGEPRRAEGGAQGRRHGLRHRGRGRRHRHRRRARSSPRSRASSRRSRSASSRGRSSSRAAGARSRPSRASSSSADKVDTLIVIENDRLLQVVEKRTPLSDAFKMADDILRQGVQGITDLITVPGIVNLDFADVRTIMRDAGSALMGIGIGAGREPRERGRAHRRQLAAARVVDRGRDRHPAQHHRPARPRPVRGQRGGRGRDERRRPERERDLRRRDRRRPARRGSRHRDRDRLRRPAPPPRARSDAGPIAPRRPPVEFDTPGDTLDVPSFLRDEYVWRRESRFPTAGSPAADIGLPPGRARLRPAPCCSDGVRRRRS